MFLYREAFFLEQTKDVNSIMMLDETGAGMGTGLGGERRAL